MLTEITNIILKNVQIEDGQVENSSDSINLAIVGECNFDNFSKFSEADNVFAVDITFKVSLVETQDDENSSTPNFNDNSEIYIWFECTYRFEFISDKYNENDTDSKNLLVKEVGKFAGPYIRELADNLFSRTNFGTPPIPIDFFENLEGNIK